MGASAMARGGGEKEREKVSCELCVRSGLWYRRDGQAKVG